jgi:hypothetical protein
LWSSKEPDLAYDDCTCCIVDKDIAASQKTLVIALSLAPRKPRASQVDPNAVSFGASEIDPNAISLPPGTKTLNPGFGRHPEDSAVNSDPKTLQNPGTLKSWSITTMFLLFARGIVLCCGATQSFIQDVSAIQFAYNIPSLASCASLYICDISPCYFWCISSSEYCCPLECVVLLFVCNTRSRRLSNSATHASIGTLIFCTILGLSRFANLVIKRDTGQDAKFQRADDVAVYKSYGRDKRSL